MQGDDTFAMLCREHDKATGGDQVYPGQRYREPAARTVWTIGAIHHDGIERAALLTDRRGDVMHLPASTLAITYERLPDVQL